MNYNNYYNNMFAPGPSGALSAFAQGCVQLGRGHAVSYPIMLSASTPELPAITSLSLSRPSERSHSIRDDDEQSEYARPT